MYKQKRSIIKGTAGHRSALKELGDMMKSDLVSPVKQRKNEGPTTNSRIKADQKENPKQIRAVDPVTGGNNAEYEREAGKLHRDFKLGKLTANELREKKKALIARLRKSSPAKQKVENKKTEKKPKGKIVYKDGKKYYQASDGTLHTGQVEDCEAELAADKKMLAEMKKKKEKAKKNPK